MRLRKSKAGELGAEQSGIATFAGFRRFDLTQTHRFRNDKQHGENVASMRNTASDQPVSEEFLESLQPLSEEERTDPKFRFATIGVVSNLERFELNAAQAYAFAKHYGHVLVRWKLDLRGAASQELRGDLLDELYDDEAGLWGFFVRDAPAVITDNIAQEKGLVNGTQCTMHSLVLRDDATDDQARLDRACKGEVVTLSRPPISINVRPQVSTKFLDLLRPDSLVANEVVVPIKASSRSDEWSPTSVFAAMNGIGVKKVRKKKDGTSTKSKSSGLLTRNLSVVLGFAVTDYKLQGKSLDVLVLSLACRPFEPPIELDGLYVLASRVRTRAGLRVLKVSNWDHLRKLRPGPQLEVWDQAYDKGSGCFSAQKASVAVVKLAERLKKAAAAAKEQAKRGQRAKAKAKKPPAASKPSKAPKGTAMNTQQHQQQQQQQQQRKQALKKSLAPAGGKDAATKKRAAPPTRAPAGRTDRPHNCGPGGGDDDGRDLRRRMEHWLQSVTNKQNSCSFDVALKAWELAVAAFCLLRGGGEAVAPQHLPASISLSNQNGVRAAREAKVGEAMAHYLRCASAVAAASTLQTASLRELNAARDAVRNELNRASKILEMNGALITRRSAQTMTEEQMRVAVMRRERSVGGAQENLMRMLTLRSEGAEHEFLGGRTPVGRGCEACGAYEANTQSVDHRVHNLPANVLHMCDGDPIRAFGARYVQPFVLPHTPCRVGGAGIGCRREGHVYERSWFGAHSIAADAPPLLMLAWDLEAPQEDVNYMVNEPVHIRLSPDTTTLTTTEHGDLAFELDVLIYYTFAGVGHYVTVGRTPYGWVCWDGLWAGGRGCILAEAPTGSNQELRVANGGKTWVGYEPTLVIYRRVSCS